jgi:HK97 family phage prohead protease/HK97 family phage major capsid protein
MRYHVRTASQDAAADEFVLSDNSVDRQGDVIEQNWELANFRANPIALFNHDRDQVIGVWDDVRVEGGRLIGKLKLASADTPGPLGALVNSVRSLLDQKILRSTSVGFREVEKQKINEHASDFWGPFRYTKSELLEVSLVAVPANPNAVSLARSMNIPPGLVPVLFVKPEQSEARPAKADVKLTVVSTQAKGPTKMANFQERIENTRNSVNVQRDRLAALQAEDVLSPADQDEFAELPGRLEHSVKTLQQLEAAERAQALAAQLTAPPPPPTAQSIVLPAPSVRSLRPIKSKFDHILRSMHVTGVAHHLRQHPEQILRELYGNDDGTAMVLKSATAPAMTGVAGWAAELAVQQAVTDMLDILYPDFIYPQVAAIGIRVTFDRFGSIKIPTRSNSTLLSGDFVAEGNPIPVLQGLFSSITLTPKKMAVITTFTREMAMHSTPTIEPVLRTAILGDTGKILDTRLLDNVASSASRPAGLLNGVTPITATAITGGALTALTTDLTNLVSALLTANAGRTIVLIMNPVDALRATMITNSNGAFVFDSLEALRAKFNLRAVLTSTTVTAKTLIALDAADFATATGDAPQFDVSSQATLHMETAPSAIGTVGAPNVVAAPTRSLWQTDTIGVRMLLDVTWAMRRSGMVQTIANVTW